MAKKTPRNQEQPESTPATPARRRAAPRKAQAAPPLDIATVGGTEPIASASDTRASGTKPGDATSTADSAYQPSHAEIAQAAYYRHLNRGVGGGGAFEDWLEAERELKARRR